MFILMGNDMFENDCVGEESVSIRLGWSCGGDDSSECEECISVRGNRIFELVGEVEDKVLLFVESDNFGGLMKRIFKEGYDVDYVEERGYFEVYVFEEVSEEIRIKSYEELRVRWDKINRGVEKLIELWRRVKG